MNELEYRTVVEVTDCCTCGGPIAVTHTQHRLFRENHTVFYCPMGHSNHYPGETEAERLKKEVGAIRAKLDQEKARTADEAARRVRVELERDKLVKRTIKNGVCPCCRRNFTALARHMKHKHPEYVKDVK